MGVWASCYRPFGPCTTVKSLVLIAGSKFILVCVGGLLIVLILFIVFMGRISRDSQVV